MKIKQLRVKTPYPVSHVRGYLGTVRQPEVQEMAQTTCRISGTASKREVVGLDARLPVLSGITSAVNRSDERSLCC